MSMTTRTHPCRRGTNVTEGGNAQGASERRGILWRWRGPSGLRWVWRNGRGPHLEAPRKPLPRWLRSFPTTASVRITAAQGHLPAACVLPLLLPEKKSPAAILCCLSLPTTTTEVFSLFLLEFCLCHCLHFSPTGARAPPTTPVQVSPDTACTAA